MNKNFKLDLDNEHYDELDDINEIDNIEDVEEEEIEELLTPKKLLWYEPEYEDVKENPNVLWIKYDERIRKTLKIMAYWKNFDKDELYQQAYIYFIDLCKIYTPYYNGNFIPFDRFVFKNIIIKSRAYIQNYYLKSKREQPIELPDRTTTNSSNKTDINDIENKVFIEYLYSLISERQAEILSLTFQGYKQQEIGNILDISQSRVSVIKKRTLKKLQEILEENEFKKK